MAYKRITLMNIWEIIRRWHQSEPIIHIATSLGYDPKTVRKYIHAAQSIGLQADVPLPAKEEVLSKLKTIEFQRKRPSKARQLLEPYLDEIVALVNDRARPLKPKYAFQVICQKYELDISYGTFKRFVKEHYYEIYPRKVTCRIERPPGQEIQIDYGYVGLHYDPVAKQKRRVYAFIGTLAFSRHQFVDYVYKLDQQSFIDSHNRMFEFFGGVPKRIVLDNLKTGVIKPDLYDPTLNKAYTEMAEHYGCFLDPCRVRKPKDKGKVENQVPVFRQKFRQMLALCPDLTLEQINRQGRQWCCGEYGHRVHGTTQLQPYPTFLELEKPALTPLPARPFEVPVWKEATVHPDHYIQFNKKTYSVPTAYIGKKVWVKASNRIVQVYYDHELVCQHTITDRYRHTHMAHFPENIQAALDEGIPKALRKKARLVGPYFGQLIDSVLQPHAFINMRKAQGILGLAKKYDHALIEHIAQIMLQEQLTATPQNMKKLLENYMKERSVNQTIPISSQTRSFIRTNSYFVHHSINLENSHERA